MSWILYVLLVLAVAGDILLAVVLAKMMHKNDEPQQKIDTADDFVRAVTPVLQSETDLLAEQLRAMQGESARTTTATLRDFLPFWPRTSVRTPLPARRGWNPLTEPGPPARRPRTMPCWPS